KRSAPAALRRRRADGLCADAGHRRGDGVLAHRLLRPGARDRIQPGLPARRARGRRGGHRPAQAHQPPQARPHRRPRRELLVSDHAHPPRGLILREVTLRDFRSYTALELELVPGVVLLHGANGAGKTNLLEALHVGTQGFSPRARRDVQMIRFGADAARIALGGSRGANAVETDTVLMRRDPRTVKLNGERIESDRLRHELTTLVFTPDRLAVVKGAPATRRAYLDRVVGRVSPARAKLANEYASAVGQRNAALRRIRAGQSTRDALAPWTDRVVALGYELVVARAE